MKHLPVIALTMFVSVSAIFVTQSVQLQAQQTAGAKKGNAMTTRASGTFEVKLSPQDEGANPVTGRMLIDKQFRGDIEGTSKGTMVMASGNVEGSAGYVAIEKVTGTVGGRRGSFYLQHSGTMNRGKPSLSITVIPDSGTEELVGLEGKMNIIIADGKHSYEFDYTLPAKND